MSTVSTIAAVSGLQILPPPPSLQERPLGVDLYFKATRLGPCVHGPRRPSMIVVYAESIVPPLHYRRT